MLTSSATELVEEVESPLASVESEALVVEEDADVDEAALDEAVEEDDPDVRSETSALMSSWSSVKRLSDDEDELESLLDVEEVESLDDEVEEDEAAPVGGGPGGGPGGGAPSPPVPPLPELEPSLDSIARNAETSAETVAPEPLSMDDVEEEPSEVEAEITDEALESVEEAVVLVWAVSCRNNW